MSTVTCVQRTVEAARRGVGAWEREAWTLIAEAEQRGQMLTEEQLVWYDVHDLQALRRRLDGKHAIALS
jgi:hypothetical protein